MSHNFNNYDWDNIFLSLWSKQEGLSKEEYLVKDAQWKLWNEQADKFRYLPPDQWGKLYFNWDLRHESQKFSFDNFKINDVQKYYSTELLAFKAKLNEVDYFLNPYSKRTLEELWKVGCVGKLARTIVYLGNNKNQISPRVIILNEAGITLHGGNHRYTVAKFAGEIDIVMYTTGEYVSQLNHF